MRPLCANKLFLLKGLLAVCIAVSFRALAQGGPPFRTDDPETPENRHFEINFGFIADRGRSAGDYEVPDFDFNYGLGNRIQLKYEVPIAIAETRSHVVAGLPDQHVGVVGGLGESLFGIKARFYEHRPGDAWLGRSKAAKAHADSIRAPGDSADLPEEPEVNFSVSTYPQLSLNNPTRSVPRGVVEGGPDFLLPLEVNGRIGPVRLDGEAGYHFGNSKLEQTWIRGLLVGHEFDNRTEAYFELYDEQDATRVTGIGRTPKQRETTLGLGGRRSLNADKTLNLLLMGGRSFQSVAVGNSQPDWIAYVGLQVLLGPKERTEPQVEQKLPNVGR
jgi:hypothetical protein